MIYQGENPGSWPEFVTRVDNKNLSIMEQKSKYNQELMMFEQFVQFQNQQQTQSTAVGGNYPAGYVFVDTVVLKVAINLWDTNREL